jgi:hypothetical protein
VVPSTHQGSVTQIVALACHAVLKLHPELTIHAAVKPGAVHPTGLEQ